MKANGWLSCAVALVLGAGSAQAAKISISDKGFIDIGALVQAQYRLTENNAGSKGDNYSHDFLLRRARILLSGQYNEHIGFIIDTDITYGAAGGATAPSPNATGFNNNIFLNEALASYKVNKNFQLDAGLMLIPYSHSSLTSVGKFLPLESFPILIGAQGNGTVGGQGAVGNNRAARDAGLLIRGLLAQDRIYYRIGVFNGQQFTAGTPAAAGPPPVPAGKPTNPGDSPMYAGMLRFNIAGKEDGYSFCQVCFPTSPIINVGISALVQPNAILGFNVPRGPTTAAGKVNTTLRIYLADIFADIPFPGDTELSLEVQGVAIKAGAGTPNSGYGLNAQIGYRFSSLMPYFSFEWFDSDSNFVGYTRASATAAPIAFVAGDLKTYHGGLNFFLDKNTYKIVADVAFQDRENAEAVTVFDPTTSRSVPKNQFVGRLQFQVNF